MIIIFRISLLLLMVLVLRPSMLQAKPQIILVLGDSLSAAYGMQPSQGWVSLLSKQLQQQYFPQRVVNASVSGATSQNLLTRVPQLLSRHQPVLTIIEIGGNDGLQGLSLLALRSNLARMIKLAQAAHSKVLLLGIKLPPNYGRTYNRHFNKIYGDLAEEYTTTLVPFILDKMALDSRLMQADGIHPNQLAQPQLLALTWPHIKALLTE